MRGIAAGSKVSIKPREALPIIPYHSSEHTYQVGVAFPCKTSC